jgi:DNA-binding GntR family transcriptional regulator
MATETYEPILLDRSMARLLEQTTGDPAFAVRRVTRDQHNRLIECVDSVLRGDRYKVIVQLERAGPRPA